MKFPRNCIEHQFAFHRHAAETCREQSILCEYPQANRRIYVFTGPNLRPSFSFLILMLGNHPWIRISRENCTGPEEEWDEQTVECHTVWFRGGSLEVYPVSAFIYILLHILTIVLIWKDDFIGRDSLEGFRGLPRVFTISFVVLRHFTYSFLSSFQNPMLISQWFLYHCTQSLRNQTPLLTLGHF